MSEKQQQTRVYPVRDKAGKTRYVETTGKTGAIVHVYDPEVGEPLSGSEVLAIIRAHGLDAIEKPKAKEPKP